MKIMIFRDWLYNRLMMAIASIVSAVFGFAPLAVVFAALNIRSFGHEFSHASVVFCTGGKIDYISLGPGTHQIIDFESTDRAMPFVYLAGTIFDSILMMIVAGTLFISGDIAFVPGIILKIVAVIIIYLTAAFHMFVKQSDFNEALNCIGGKWSP